MNARERKIASLKAEIAQEEALCELWGQKNGSLLLRHLKELLKRAEAQETPTQ